MMGMMLPGWDFSFSSISHYRTSRIHVDDYGVTTRRPIWAGGMSSRVVDNVCLSFQSDWRRMCLC